MNSIQSQSGLIIFFFLLLSGFAQADNPDGGQYSAADSAAIAELTVEEMQFYQTDFLPLSLAEKGRQSVTAWRGMPGGFLNYQFQHVPLVMPLWGYWDNQLIPHELIRHRHLIPSALVYDVKMKRIEPRLKPKTRVAFSQDLQFGLSYLDINFSQFYRPQSFFHLSGSNFLRTGSQQGLTDIKVNTYRAQFHHHFSEKFTVDLWYWQQRHTFAISPLVEFAEQLQIKRIGQLLWLNFQYVPDSTSRFLVTPYAYKWGDRYKNVDFTVQRKTEMYSTGLKFEYEKRFRKLSFSIVADVVRHKITQAFVYRLKDQGDRRILLGSEFKAGQNRLLLQAGYRSVSDLSGKPEFQFNWIWNLPFGFRSDLSLVSKPAGLPLSGLFWQGYGIRPFPDPQIPLRRAAEWQLQVPLPGSLQLVFTPFYAEFLNAWGYNPQDSLFIQQDYDNSGITASLNTPLLFLRVENQTTYNQNYQSSFAPRFRNVLKVRLPISLFQEALKIDAYLIYHFIGSWYRADYDPFVNQYFRTNDETGNYHIIDAKILAHIKTATLFAVWDNILSQDYALVNGYREIFRMFRFGIYWTLFD